MDLRKFLPFGFGLMTLILIGVFITPHDKNKTEEQLLRTVFAAIAKGDWEEYRPYLITIADIAESVAAKAEGRRVSPLGSKMGYAGGVLGPEEMKIQKALFDKAAEGGEGVIDFQNAKFLGLGTVIETGHTWEAAGDTFPTAIYSLRIEQDGEEVDTKDLFPQFVVVAWKKRWLIHGLVGKGSEAIIEKASGESSER